MAFADLHMHSNASDGVCDPSSIAQAARSASELRALALTDHDTLDGLEDAAASCASEGVMFVPGVEITSKHEDRPVHMLGYFIDSSDRALAEYLKENKGKRASRAYRMADLLAEDGFPLSSADLKDSGLIPNRPSLARLLVDKGCAESIDDAFKRYLNSHSKYYVDAIYPETYEVISMILEAGGYPFVAHPARYGIIDLIEDFAREGITGIEAYHSLQTAEQSKELVELAKSIGIGVSGGSDWHGDTMHHAKPGCCGLNEQEFDAFLRTCERV